MITHITKKSLTKKTVHVCPFHRKFPDKPYAGCTCSAKYVLCKDFKDRFIEEIMEYK